LTFDVERPDFYSDVYPLLKKYGFKATVFVRTDYVENGCPSWEQLREMRDSGLVEIGSHSVGHPVLTCLSLPEAKREILMSKAILEEKLGSRIVIFSYYVSVYGFRLLCPGESIGVAASEYQDPSLRGRLPRLEKL
jgi:peptidoglycan/xylan/chitin deacetylase (PgdA/CDA1 family)